MDKGATIKMEVLMSPKWALLAVLGCVMVLCMWDKCLADEEAEPTTICFNESSSPSLAMFVDELPILPVLDAASGHPITLGAYKIHQKLHRDLPSTTLYAFGTSRETAQYPGPILEAKRGRPTKVRWENHIDDDVHFLPVDSTLSIPQPQNGGIPIVVHLHGGETVSSSDGHPEAWFTSQGDTGPSYVTQDYKYQNSQPSTMLWYHDHTLGITRLNLAAGLMGIYIIRSPSEDQNVRLPSGPYEIVLAFQDKRFFANGRIRFPNVGAVPAVHPAWCPEYLGDTMIVNGKVWPFLNVEPRRYRFRMLNANTERFLLLSLLTSAGSNLSFIQIGTDGGFLPQPRWLTTILLAPAERIDIIIDFENLTKGTEVFLLNSARAPYPSGNLPGNTQWVMKFIVAAATVTGGETSNPPIPSVLDNQTLAVLQHRGVQTTRIHQLLDLYSSFSTQLPVQILLNNKRWKDAPTEIVQEGSKEIWEIINLTEEAHPIHIHLINFQVIDLQSLDIEGYTNQSCSVHIPYPKDGTCFLGPPETPMPFMMGWKDTITTLPTVVTRIIIRFTTREGAHFSFNATSFPGYLWHCHLLGHEDNEMMRPMLVT